MLWAEMECYWDKEGEWLDTPAAERGREPKNPAPLLENPLLREKQKNRIPAHLVFNPDDQYTFCKCEEPVWKPLVKELKKWGFKKIYAQECGLTGEFIYNLLGLGCRLTSVTKTFEREKLLNRVYSTFLYDIEL